MDVDFGAEILKNSMKFLLEASEIIPNTIPSLKSYCASKCRIIGLQGDFCLPTKVTKSTVRCPRCCLTFTDYKPSVILKPQGRADKYLRKIQRKIQNGKRLTSYQKKRSADVEKINCNVIVKICKNCKNESKIYTPKPTKQKVSNNTPQKLSKKKKKKDKHCGLAVEAVHLDQKNTPIKYNTIATILEHSKAKVATKKTVKEKIMERRQKKQEKGLRKNLNNLLNDSGKSNTVVRLKSFLQDL